MKEYRVITIESERNFSCCCGLKTSKITEKKSLAFRKFQYLYNLFVKKSNKIIR